MKFVRNNLKRIIRNAYCWPPVCQIVLLFVSIFMFDHDLFVLYLHFEISIPYKLKTAASKFRDMNEIMKVKREFLSKEWINVMTDELQGNCTK